jgi:outer membrane immunogenic protein
MKACAYSSVTLVALLICGSAAAGEMAGAARYNWTALYAGAHGGWGWVNERSVAVTDPMGSFPVGFTSYGARNGVLGGVQAGFDWQYDNWVLGAEGDWSWSTSDVETASNSPAFPGLVSHGSAHDNWFATLAGRIGFAQDRWLVYAKGGWAWMNVDYGASATGVPVYGAFAIRSASSTRDGWTVGGGIETALGSNWSAKLEYNYMDFGGDQYFFPVTSPPVAAGVGRTENIFSDLHAVKLGLNYRLDWRRLAMP